MRVTGNQPKPSTCGTSTSPKIPIPGHPRSSLHIPCHPTSSPHPPCSHTHVIPAPSKELGGKNRKRRRGIMVPGMELWVGTATFGVFAPKNLGHTLGNVNQKFCRASQFKNSKQLLGHWEVSTPHPNTQSSKTLLGEQQQWETFISSKQIWFFKLSKINSPLEATQPRCCQSLAGGNWSLGKI